MNIEIEQYISLQRVKMTISGDVSTSRPLGVTVRDLRATVTVADREIDITPQLTYQERAEHEAALVNDYYVAKLAAAQMGARAWA